MPLDILTFGEALVEVMRTEVGQALDRPALFTGPYPSGAPFIFAVQAARLGAKVGAIGAVGDDAFGKCLLDQLHVDGVDTRGVTTLKTHTTGVAFVAYNPDGSRDFVFHARHAAAGQLSVSMLKPDLFDGLKCLHLMGSTLSIHAEALAMGWRAVELAREAGAKISFDPNLRPQLSPVERARVAFKPIIDAADVLMPTAEEAQLLTGKTSTEEAIQSLLDDYAERIIILTQGKAGCTVYRMGVAPTHVPSFSVNEVDPTGAGDCFDAGFLTRWLAGDPPETAARFANACGALAVTAQGPMAGAQTSDLVLAFINQQRSS
ncbi:MAG: sugar kinase [Anaerolineae bacterium]|nr:sugar kinase [Anaerolineae bacterium]